MKAGLFAARQSAPRIHGLSQLLARYPEDAGPTINEDDLDLLDPWVIDGRYGADLPDVEAGEANALVSAAARILEGVRALLNEPK